MTREGIVQYHVQKSHGEVFQFSHQQSNLGFSHKTQIRRWRKCSWASFATSSVLLFKFLNKHNLLYQSRDWWVSACLNGGLDTDTVRMNDESNGLVSKCLARSPACDPQSSGLSFLVSKEPQWAIPSEAVHDYHFLLWICSAAGFDMRYLFR